jgi:gluconolactonase
MKLRKIAIILLVVGVSTMGIYSCAELPDYGPTSEPLTEPIENLKVIEDGFSFTEGPAVDADGNVYFTDQPNDRIHKWDATTGQVSLFMEGTGRSNGMAFDKDGNLITCADMHGEVWKINVTTKAVTVLVDNYDGKLLNGPNDVWINPVTGGMYITDPIFPRGYWDANDPRRTDNFNFDAGTGTYTGSQKWPPVHSEQGSFKSGHVYYLAPGAASLVRVTTMSDWNADSWPNGIVGTPDGKKLYVNKWQDNNLGGMWSFDIKADGTLENITKVSSIGGDGMSMDAKGNIYISNGQGIKVLDPSPSNLNVNKLILTIPVSNPASGATNNVFAGKDQKTLIITGPVDKLTSLQVNVAGVEKF